MSWGFLHKHMGVQHRSLIYYIQQLDTVGKGLPLCMRACSVTAALIKSIKEKIMVSPLTIYITHAVEVLIPITLNTFLQADSTLMESYC